MAHACGHCGNEHGPSATVCPVTGGALGASYTLVNEDEALVGNVIGERYHLREILGQGCTGTVFGTEHLGFGRNAAMKVLRPRYTPLESVRNVFQNETRAALSITHPSLCEVFDVGTLPDGAPFFVMERLQGDTLASRLGRERFSAATAVDVTMQLLSAMDALHERNILFRDLRPQNIFLAHRRGCRPVVKILDVGLARLLPLERIQTAWEALRAVSSESDVTGLLAIPYYLSPERARGDRGIEPSSDLFVAAVILYEALTGRKPFAATSWQALIHQIIAAQPESLTTLRPDLPDAFGSLVMRALAANPRARPPSAREMQEELRGVFDGPRRGSQSMQIIPAALPMLPHDEPAVSSARTTDPVAPITAPVTADEPDDEQTDRKPVAAMLANPGDTVDEASADHPIRTARPPRMRPADAPVSSGSAASDLDIEIDVELGDDGSAGDNPVVTSRGSDLDPTLDVPIPRLWRRGNEEEETANMELTPAVRARIERMTNEPASGIEDSNRPPPTRRLKPPRGG